MKPETIIKTAQVRVDGAIRHLETLSKVDRIMFFLESQLPEHITATMKTEEQLGVLEEYDFPLRVTGRMLGVGRHKIKYYTEEELEKSALNHKTFPIKLDHKKNEASSTIGLVDRIWWDPVAKCVCYEGHINDETHARNIIDRAHTDVSAGISSIAIPDLRLGVVGVDIEYTELSIVEEGSYKENSIGVVK
jgi:hypothetical protein